MQFTWKIVFIWDVESVGANNSPKQTIVLEEHNDKEYKSSLAVDFWSDKTGLLQSYSIGDIVTVSLNPKAREYNGKYYNSISCRKIEWSSNLSWKPSDSDDDLPF